MVYTFSCGVAIIIAGMSEKPDANHIVSLQRQPLLSFHEFIFEACAPAEGDDFVFSYH